MADTNKTWITESAPQSFSVGSTIDDTISKYGSTDSQVSGVLGDNIDFGGIDSVVGMKADKIPSIKENLESYISKVNAIYEKLQTEVEVNKAIYNSNLGAEVKTFLDTYKEYLKNLTTYLKVFNDKLTAVHNDYLAYEASQQTTVSASGKTYTVDAYTEQVQSSGQ